MFNPRLLASQRSKFAKIILALFLAFLILPLAASAQGVVPNIQTVFANSGFGSASLGEIIINMIRLFFALLGFIALFLMLYGGFVWMTSQGDIDKVKTAKQILYNAIIGLIVIFSAFAIATFVLNILRGATGGVGGGGGTNIPGGSGDFSRSAIGAGPIEAVYPKPNQTNVPINTQIAVTFKVDIKPETICDNPAASYCNGEAINNIEICERNDNDDKCKEDSEFTATTFAGYQVRQVSPTDFRTFIITSNSDSVNLGKEDNNKRTFKVLLKQGITAATTNKSVFDGLRVPYYHWSFKTNGVLDLTPPEIANVGIYPNPDDAADTYTAGAAATAGQLTLKINDPVAERPVIFTDYSNSSAQTPYFGDPLSIGLQNSEQGSALQAKLYVVSAFSANNNASKNFDFTISNDGAYAIFGSDWSSNLGLSGFSTCQDSSYCLPLDTARRRINTGSGWYIETVNGSFTQGGSWRLTATGSKTGKTLTFSDGSQTTKFVYVNSNYAGKETISRTTVVAGSSQVSSENYYTIPKRENAGLTAIATAGVLNNFLGSKITAIPAGDRVQLVAKNAGINQMGLTTDAIAGGLEISGSLSGAEKEIGWTVNGVKDPYNNSKIRITFTEPINPIGIENFIAVKKDGTVIPPADYNVSLTNQYRTIELSSKKVCGINACGQEITCWLDPSTTAPASTPIEVILKAAVLKNCGSGTENDTANAWCKNWGGTCNPGTNGRCRLTSGLNFPQADTDPRGLTDMTNNSFNGNFNKAQNAKGASVSNADGQTGITTASELGHSGWTSPYNANNHLTGVKFNQEASDQSGDDFKWSFFMSNQIDNSAPLISKIIPTGNQAYGQGNGERFSDPIKFTFGGLMSYATAKPGYGYGLNQSDPLWHLRHLLLKTLTAGANPVGYWTNSRDIDSDGDGLADYTAIDLEHNAFDQSVSYGPLAGSGLQSLTQNCFLPGNGPQNAGDANVAVTSGVNNCRYGVGGATAGCVTDSDIAPANRVSSTNPASYGYMNCNQVDGAVECAGSGKQCKVHTATSTAAANGSWVITKDHPAIMSGESATGKTGCCFGKCL